VNLLALVEHLMGANWGKITPGLAVQLGLKLAGVVPELLHLPADAHLSPEARLKIEDAIAQFETEVGL